MMNSICKKSASKLTWTWVPQIPVVSLTICVARGKLLNLSVSFHTCKMGMPSLKYIVRIKWKNVGKPLTEHSACLAAGVLLTAQLCVYWASAHDTYLLL